MLVSRRRLRPGDARPRHRGAALRGRHPAHRRRCAGRAVQRQPRLRHPARLRLRPAGAGRACTSAPRLADIGRPVLVGDVAVYPLPYLEPCPGRRPARRRRAHPRRRAAAPRWRGCAPTGRAARRPLGRHGPRLRHRRGHQRVRARHHASAACRAVPPRGLRRRRLRALGHLHGRQEVSETVRYCGSPVALSFSEASHTKGILAASTCPAHSGVPSSRSRRRCVRPLAVLRGTLERAARRPAPTRRRGGLVPGHPHRRRSGRSGAMEQLRRRFPHTLVLQFDPQGAPVAAALLRRAGPPASRRSTSAATSSTTCAAGAAPPRTSGPCSPRRSRPSGRPRRSRRRGAGRAASPRRPAGAA